jgi:hypothetical protein
MEDDDAPEKIRRFLKENGYVVSKRDITQILNQMAHVLERQIGLIVALSKDRFYAR